MPEPERLSRERQAELAADVQRWLTKQAAARVAREAARVAELAAAEADRESEAAKPVGMAAEAEIAAAFKAWTHKEARRYARMFRLDADDVAQAGFARLRQACRYYKPETGLTLLNYYCNAAGRAMVEYCRKESAVAGRAVVDAEVVGFAAAAAGRPDREAARDALESLPPVQRLVIERCEGLDGGPGASIEAVAAELGVTPARAVHFYEQAITALREKFGEAVY